MLLQCGPFEELLPLPVLEVGNLLEDAEEEASDFKEQVLRAKEIVFQLSLKLDFVLNLKK